MPAPDIQSHALAANLAGEIADPNVLTANQAKLYSHAVRRSLSGQGLPNWMPAQSQAQLDDAARLIEAARILRESEDFGGAENAFRRAGDLLEWLARADDQPQDGEPVPLGLLAAACFQLAGFPAMALGLLSQTRLPVASGRIFAAFLRADFDAVLSLCSEHWRDNLASTKPEGATLVINNGNEDDTRPNFLANEVVRSLGLIAHSLRCDQKKRLAQAIAKLKALARHAARAVESEFVWFVLVLSAEVAVGFARDSLWRGMERLRPSFSPDGAARCARFVRAMFREKKGLLWPSQRAVIERLAARGSFAMCTPTGSGKTTVAELALWQALFPPINAVDPLAGLGAAPLVLYLVPSRALASEVEARLCQDIGRLESDVIITGLYGGADWSLADAWLTAEKPTVLVCTVEMAESLWRYFGPLLSRRLELLIIDEAHQVQFDGSPQARESLRFGENRAARLESFVSRLFANVPRCRAVALSAVAGGAEEAIARWISGNPNDLAVGTTYRSTRQLIGALECHASGTARIRLELLNGRPLALAGRGEVDAYIPVPFPQMPGVTGPLRSDMNGFTRAHIVWASIQFAHAGKRVLVSVAQGIDSPLGTFRTLLATDEQRAWRGALPVFFQAPIGDKQRLYQDCLSACADYCGEHSHEYLLLTVGVAVHHGQLPVRVRRLMTEVIKAGITPVTIATSTLTEGVNMPFDVILVASVVRSQQQPTLPGQTASYDWSVVSAGEFSNLAGRAGRPGAGVEGLTLVALPVEPTSEAAKTSRKQRSQIRQIEGRFDELIEKLQTTGDNRASARSPLAELLNALWTSYRVAFAGDDADFLAWLETANPTEGAEATPPASEAADLLDSLDFVLLAAVEEVEQLRQVALPPAEIEAHLRVVWARSYARFASTETARLENIFISRGRNIPFNIIPEAARRRQLYQLGLPPRRGAAFLVLAEQIEAHLRTARDYSQWDAAQRVAFIETAAELAQTNSSFRFRKAGADEWRGMLRWWLRVPAAPGPEMGQVRDWLKVATSDFEFRLGTAISSTVAMVWNRANGGTLQVPDLDTWKQMTGLPWAALWMREFLAWGTLEPVAAFLIANGRAITRAEAEGRVNEYVAWFRERYADLEADERMNPKRLREWCDAQFPSMRHNRRERRSFQPASLARDFSHAEAGEFPVIGLPVGAGIMWLDPAGYLLAESPPSAVWSEEEIADTDFALDPVRHTVWRTEV